VVFYRRHPAVKPRDDGRRKPRDDGKGKLQDVRNEKLRLKKVVKDEK